MDLKSTYNKIAPDWARDHYKDAWWQEGTDTLLGFLPKGSSILDVGCGAGNKTAYMASKSYKVEGIDFSEKMIEIAKKDNPGIHFQVLDLYDLDTYPKKFDAVFAQAVLLHVPKTRVLEVLQKMKDRLNPNGLIYLAVKAIKPDGVEEGILKESDYGYDYERFFSYFSPEELEKYLVQLGFSSIWQKHSNSPQNRWLQVIARKG